MTNIEKKGYHPVIVRIYNKDKQMVLEDEVLCAYDTVTSKIQAIGSEARKHVDDNQVAVVNPLKWGAVADYTVFQKLMKLYIKKAMGSMFLKPRMALCIPAKLSEVEGKAFEDAFMMSDIREVYTFEKTFEEMKGEALPVEMKQPGLYVEFVSDYYKSEYFG